MCPKKRHSPPPREKLHFQEQKMAKEFHAGSEYLALKVCWSRQKRVLTVKATSSSVIFKDEQPVHGPTSATPSDSHLASWRMQYLGLSKLMGSVPRCDQDKCVISSFCPEPGNGYHAAPSLRPRGEPGRVRRRGAGRGGSQTHRSSAGVCRIPGCRAGRAPGRAHSVVVATSALSQSQAFLLAFL